MKTQVLYRLVVSAVDGSEAETVKAYTPHLSVAQEWKNKSWWNVYYPITMVIIEDLEELAVAEADRKKQAAMRKLTEEERKLLGLE